MKQLAVFLVVYGASQASWAANICNETVASTRMVDGIPAYKQCTDSTSSAIYSNNGVDTATASAGSDWVRTQYSGGYQCTELAHRYLYFKWNVKNVPNGNAGVWCDGTIPSGLEKTATPVHGDIIVFAPGSCGADATTGHVAVVDVVNTNSTVTFVEQNGANRRSCAISTAACFLHAIANTGTGIDGGAPDSATPDTGSVSTPDVGVRRETPPDNRRGDGPASGGAMGTGGAAGSGGVIGTGGAMGSGGAVASSGVMGTGGMNGSGGSSSEPSAGGSGGSTASTEPAISSGDGCACRLADGRSADAGWGPMVFVVLVLAGVVLRRRRSRF